MIPAVVAVRNACCSTFPAQETFSIEQVSNGVEAYTRIDTVLFVGYNVPVTNPIWGEFRRFDRSIPYRGHEEIVEIRYANHLPLHWLRFVVVKELCHALEHRTGTHTVSDSAVSTLITTLALVSGAQSASSIRLAVNAERLAELCAMEILAPLSLRNEMIADGTYGTDGPDRIGQRLELPSDLVSQVFEEQYMAVSRSVFV